MIEGAFSYYSLGSCFSFLDRRTGGQEAEASLGYKDKPVGCMARVYGLGLRFREMGKRGREKFYGDFAISKSLHNFVVASAEKRPAGGCEVKNAVVAQLVEHQLPKLRVASSSLVYRSEEERGCVGLRRNLFLMMPAYGAFLMRRLMARA